MMIINIIKVIMIITRREPAMSCHYFAACYVSASCPLLCVPFSLSYIWESRLLSVPVQMHCVWQMHCVCQMHTQCISNAECISNALCMSNTQCKPNAECVSNALCISNALCMYCISNFVLCIMLCMASTVSYVFIVANI